MSSRIQRIPRGLLAFLDMVGTGQNPVVFGDAVAPVVDIRDFYLSETILSQEATGTAQNAGDTITLSVPANTTWIVRAIQATLNVNAGEIARISIAVRPAGLNSIGLVTSDLSTTPAGLAIDRKRLGIWLGAGLILRPGSAVSLRVDSSTLAAARSANVGALFHAAEGG